MEVNPIRNVGLVLASIVWMTTRCDAFEVQQAEAHFDQREYRVDLRVLLDAPVDKVNAVLRDYAHYPGLEASILEAKTLQRPTVSTVMLYTKLRACSGIFCRTVNRVERVEEGELELTATAIPEQSDVSAGVTHTQLLAQGNRTLVTYRTRITPKFWVPALIGRPLMLRRLQQASLDMFRNVETRAKQ